MEITEVDGYNGRKASLYKRHITAGWDARGTDREQGGISIYG
jgi:hypothetical protein